MWSSTVGLVNGKHRYLTAETFGFKVNSNGQVLKRRQQWTIEPFPENLGPDNSISSAASVSSQCNGIVTQTTTIQQQQQQHQQNNNIPTDPNDPCILTFNSSANSNIQPGVNASSLTSIKSSSNGSSAASDQENCGEEHENIAIKSHLNKYLAVDSFGNVTCDSEEKTENARFTITICSMSQGRSKDEHIFWAFKNVERGYYLGTTDDGMICCNTKMPRSRAELWHLHLIPARGASFFAIKSLGRKRFARVFKESDESSSSSSPSSTSANFIDKKREGQEGEKPQVQLDATISWGSETLFQLKYFDGGRYSILTSDCLYLTNEGECLQWKAPQTNEHQHEHDNHEHENPALPPNECLFTLEYHSGYLAFRDHFSHYLAAAGRSSVLRSRSIGVSRDELFLFESAPIQVSLKATFNNRWVSIKQGVDLSANQTETTGKFETFQLTYHKQTQNWSIMTYDCNFWTLSQNTSTISICKPGDYEGMNRGQFKLIWSENDATCSLKFIDSNQQEKWIAARKSGQLFLATGNLSGSQPASPPVKFIMRFQNRKLLNLRPVDGNGFVGLKMNTTNSSTNVLLDANKTSPDSIAIEYSEFSNQNNISKTSSKFVLNNCNNLPQLSEINTMNSNENELINEQPTINMFNVRLNSTKMGQSVLERCNGSKQQNSSNVSQLDQDLISAKELEMGIDDNNNCIEDLVENKNGSVESTSIPSVASIINSFSSNTRITSEQQQMTNSNSNNSSRIVNSLAVPKLASSFNNGTIVSNNNNHLATLNEDSPSTIYSSTASSSTEPQTIISLNNGLINNNNNESSSQQQQMSSTATVTAIKADQLAQSECCYLKIISNDKYLVVGDNESSIVCDATNKACAQSWILELRSHNSIAIRASDNHAYMQLGTNGTIFLSRCEPSQASLWEF